jgi:hypothetical protein
MSTNGRTLPAWEQADLPAPPPFSLRAAIGVIGPGAILLGTSIGSGEWLIGPAVTAKYGGALLWVATASIILQVIMNMEFIRYTMYTGEPIFTGFMRTGPGRLFWGPVYAVLAFLQLGWPGWALAAATAIAAAFLGRLPGDGDRQLVIFWGFITFLLTLVIVAYGSRIETTMERAEWIMVALILAFLGFVGVVFVTPDTWGRVAQGFVSFGALPEGADWLLLGGFAAYAGAGGVINAAISNWFRDKGFGMGAAVGYIPALIGGRQVNLSHTGKVFPVTPENKRRWDEWWRYAGADQYWVWVLGCFLGMGLPALITVQFIPPGTNISGFAVAAFQAEYLSRQFGQIMWFLTLLTGFWVLFSTQLGITDAFVRLVTDVVWTTSGRVRDAAEGDVRKVYYGVMLVFATWGCIAITQTAPLILILIGANMAGFNFIVLGLHTVHLNRKVLPAELRPALWREVVVLLTTLFFLFFVSVTLLDQLGKNPIILGLPSMAIVGGWFALGASSAAVLGLLNRAANGEDTPAWMLAAMLFWPAAVPMFFTQRSAAAPAAGEPRPA